MKIKISIAIIWAALATLFFYCVGCSREIQPVSSVKLFTVMEVYDKTFLAKYGRLEVTFFKVDCDSVWEGKTITVSQGNKIK